MFHQSQWGSVAHQGEHSGERHTGLLIAGDEHPQEEHRVGDEADEVHEEGELAHGELTAAHRRCRHHQHDSGSDAHRVPEQRLEHRFEDFVLYGHGAPLVAEAAEVAHHRALRSRDLDGLHRAEGLSQRLGHPSRGDPCRLAVPLDPMPRRSGEIDHDHRRPEHDQGEEAVDGHQHRDGDDGEHGEPDHVDRPRERLDVLVDVVAEPADGVAGRLLHRLGSGQLEDALQHVAAEQRSDPEHEVDVVPHRHDHERDPTDGVGDRDCHQ